MRLVFDIDNTVCDVVGKDYYNAQPRTDMVALINELHDAGVWIGFYTARGMGTLDGDVVKVRDTWYDFTYRQLKSWGLKFDGLWTGKPNADLYIDDRAFGAVGVVDVGVLRDYLKGLL